MKKMEKTAGEKPGKDIAILKDNEAAAKENFASNNPEKASKKKSGGCKCRRA